MRRKISREEIRSLVYQGMRDEEIGLKLNLAASTVQNVRLKEFRIKRTSIFFLANRERKFSWKSYKGKTSGGIVVLTMPFLRMLFSDIDNKPDLRYKINYELPDKIIIRFRKVNFLEHSS